MTIRTRWHVSANAYVATARVVDAPPPASSPKNTSPGSSLLTTAAPLPV